MFHNWFFHKRYDKTCLYLNNEVNKLGIHFSILVFYLETSDNVFVHDAPNETAILPKNCTCSIKKKYPFLKILLAQVGVSVRSLFT